MGSLYWVGPVLGQMGITGCLWRCQLDRLVLWVRMHLRETEAPYAQGVGAQPGSPVGICNRQPRPCALPVLWVKLCVQLAPSCLFS